MFNIQLSGDGTCGWSGEDEIGSNGLRDIT
jgi:hypothetical protein